MTSREKAIQKRTTEMIDIANTIAAMMHRHNEYTVDVTIRYECPTDETITNFTDWHRRYHHIFPGEEYYMIYEKDSILYVVNVSGDDALTAAEELMHIVAAKF